MRSTESVQKSTTLDQLARRWAFTQPAVASFVSALVPNFHDSQDVVQETAAAVFAYDFDKQGWPDSFQAWAITIARHKVIDFFRRKGTRDSLLFDAETIDQLIQAHARFTDRLDARCEALEHCMQRVPSNMRELLEMRYQHDMSPPEIAARAGLGISAVKVGLHRIRLALRTCIERRLGREELA